MERNGPGDRQDRLDAELARLLHDPDSIGYRPVRSRLGRIAQPPRRRRRRGHMSAARSRTTAPRGVWRPSWVFVALVLLTVGGGAMAARAPLGSRTAGVGVFVLVLAAWLVSVCLHEFAHALVAFAAGDHGVVEADYLRLNPFRYVHPLLSIVLPLLWIVLGGIGLPGGAVLIHPHRLRSRGWASAVSAAGPAVNIVIALVAVASLRYVDGSADQGVHGLTLHAAVGWFAWLQLSVAILNLLPIPGLDGWGILEPWVSPQTAQGAARIKPYGFLILVLLLWTPSLSGSFSNLVDRVAVWLGDPAGLPWLGAQLFQFWSR